MVDPLLITPDEVRSVQSFKVGATDWPVWTHERMPAGDRGVAGSSDGCLRV
jgi:hypothetical protein